MYQQFYWLHNWLHLCFQICNLLKSILALMGLKKVFCKKNNFWCIYRDMNNLKPIKKGRGRPKVDIHSKLTRKQELFVKELVSNDGTITMREAAINAGFPVSSAHTRAYEMTNPEICPHVCRAIQIYRDELDEKYGVTYKRHYEIYKELEMLH